jgi:hypothetical protein
MKKILIGLTLLASMSSFAQFSADTQAAIVVTKIQATVIAGKQLFPKDGDLCKELKKIEASGKMQEVELIVLVEDTLDYTCD